MPNKIDLPRCTDLWTEQDRNLFNQLPVYFAKTQSETLKLWQRWPKLLQSMPWQANKGPLMRGVRKERSPVNRSQFIPQPITSAPRKDVLEVRELTEHAQIYRHDFESDLLHFLPSWQDFLTDHVTAQSANISEKIQVALDLFYRTAIFHGSPQVWIPGKAVELTNAAHFTDQNIVLSKNTAALLALIAELPADGGFLNLATLKKLGTVMYNDVMATPFTGSILADGSDGKALAMKYVLVAGSEVWDAFSDDNGLLNNKTDSLDIIGGSFMGSLFGRWTTLLERFEMRIAADGTVPVPQTTEEGDNAYNEGETVMNPAYVNAPFGVAFAVGGEAWKAVMPGVPPKEWNNQMTMRKFANLQWNGRVEMTQNVMVPCLDGAGNPTLDTNKRGEYIQLISSLAMGIMPIRRRNIVPIIYRRRRPGTNL